MDIDELLLEDGEDFLEHYGIKGMRWGVRRDRGSDGLVVRPAGEHGTVPMNLLRNRKTGDFHEINPDGSPGKVLAKKSDVGKDGVVQLRDHPSDTAKTRSVHSPGGLDGNPNTSADHERAAKAYAKVQEKGFQSLSNEEVKAIINRVKAEKDFRQITTDEKSKMQKAVERMQLEKQYAQLSAERAKATRSTGRKLIDALAKKTLDVAAEQAAAMGQQMLNEALGIKPSKTELMKAEIEKMKVQREHAQLKKDLRGLGVSTAQPGSAFKVNKNKVTFTPTKLGGVSRTKP